MISMWYLFGSFSDIVFAQLVTSTEKHNLTTSAGSTMLTNASIRCNPALLTRIDSLTATITVVPSRFGLKELGVSSLTISSPLSSQFSLGSSLMYSGSSIYNELGVSVLSAMKLTSSLQVGISSDFHRISIQDASPLSTMQLHAGALFVVSPVVTLSTVFRNILRSVPAGETATAYQQSVLGAGIIVDDDCRMDLDAVITLNRSTSLRLALLYQLFSLLELRVALQNNPQILQAEIRFDVGNSIGILAGMSHHTLLGTNTIIGVQYNGF